MYNFCNASDILQGSCNNEWKEILAALEQFNIHISDIKSPGGNKSPIPKKLDTLLFPLEWREEKISGTLEVKREERNKRNGKYKSAPTKSIKNYIDGHNIDFVKGRVAFDVEWNSKDQTFDRDLLAMRTYYDCGLISVGIILTREEELNDIFTTLYYLSNKQKTSIMKKYGASTTWVGKLTSRLESRRNGGCPILVLGITKKCVTDWEEGYIDNDFFAEINETEDED